MISRSGICGFVDLCRNPKTTECNAGLHRSSNRPRAPETCFPHQILCIKWHLYPCAAIWPRDPLISEVFLFPSNRGRRTTPTVRGWQHICHRHLKALLDSMRWSDHQERRTYDISTPLKTVVHSAASFPWTFYSVTIYLQHGCNQTFFARVSPRSYYRCSNPFRDVSSTYFSLVL